MMDGYYGHGTGGGEWVVMILLMLVFWALLVFGAVLAYRALTDRSSTGSRATPSKGNAQEVLEERFARGEIDVDEYTRRRDLLRIG